MAKKNSTKYKSNKQEKRIAKDMRGRTTIASGALSIQKADVRNDKFLVECKTTENSYYSLSLKTWKTIQEQALRDNIRIPVMNIELRGGKNSIAVLSYLDFISLDLDTHQYVGNPVPDFIDAKSFRVTPDFIYENYSQQYDGVFYRRRDVKFVDYNTHLVMLEWEDFLKLIKEEQN